MRRYAFTLFLLLLPGAGSAQSVFENAASDVKHGAGDVLWVWTSPARLQARDLAGLGVVVGGTAAVLLADESVQRLVDDNPRSAFVQAFGWFREDQPGEQLGNIWLLIRASGVAWAAGLLAGNETLREAGMGCAVAGMAQTFPRRLLVYRSVARTRPRYTDDATEFSVPGSSAWEQRSFFGGHAANAMTCVSFLANRYHLGYLEPLLYAAAGATGFGRVLDRAHWTSDTFLGLAFGYAVGRAVAHRGLVRARAAAAAPDSAVVQPSRLDKLLSSLSVGPTADGGVGIAVRWQAR